MDKKLAHIVIRTEFYNRTDETLAVAEVLLDVGDPKNLSATTIVDACQRAVAQCVERLENELDISG